LVQLLIGEQSRADDEMPAGPLFQRELAAVACDCVQRQVSVFPILELELSHVERYAMHLAQLDIGCADQELPSLQAHRRAALATSARLMEHEIAVSGSELVDQSRGGSCRFDA